MFKLRYEYLGPVNLQKNIIYILNFAWEYTCTCIRSYLNNKIKIKHYKLIVLNFFLT